MASTGGNRGRLPWRLTSLLVLVLALLVTVGATWATHVVVRDQERRLLKERSAELGIVLTSAIDAIPARLSAQGGILTATNGSRPAYERSAAQSVTAGQAGPLTFAWLRPATSGHGFVVLAEAGAGLRRGQLLTDERATTFAQALRQPQLVATKVIGPDRKLGFAMGPPAAPAGTVLYQEQSLGPLKAPRAAGTAPFAELDIAIYGANRPDPAMVLSSTTTQLPMHGDVDNSSLVVGAEHWLVSVRPKQPLVGSVASNAQWFVLAGGIIGSLLIAAVVEIAGRRRDSALALYASEHQVAETLQRSLLPRLPIVPGLDLAARYLAGGRGQQVGGDWFDVFPVTGGQIGIAVGDVIGHDLAAATAMAQIRAALRAFALDGDSPAHVMDRLDHLVDTLGLTELVTVVYGLLEPTRPDGGRLLRFANAGHLPPLLRQPDGSIEPLAGGTSAVIGAPITLQHAEAEQYLEAGSTLVLFTDGLVEMPGRSLDESIEHLIAAIRERDDADVEAMCDRILATTSDRDLRDDIALLAVRIANTPAPAPAAAAMSLSTLSGQRRES